MKMKFLWVVFILIFGFHFFSELANAKSIFPNSKPFVVALQKRVYANWEPNCSDEVEVKFKVNRADGMFKEISLVKSSNNEQHNFACIEAVRTSSGFWKYPPVKSSSEVYLKFSKKLDHCKFDCSKLYRKAKGELSQDAIVVHLIPIDVLQTFKNIDPKVIHSVRNLRVIKLKNLSSRDFEKFRFDWINFLRNNESLTEAKLLAKAKDLEGEYRSIFKKE